MLARLLLACTVARVSVPSSSAAASPPTAKFGVPVLVGRSNSSDPSGQQVHGNFWFPSISIPTGIKDHVAQHITLSGDGGACPHPGVAHCEQIMLTKDGGKTYEVVKRVDSGTSGNFDGYGDLGAWVPAKKGEATPGTFKTIVGCNDCAGGSENKPAFLQTWVDDGSVSTCLSLVR